MTDAHSDLADIECEITLVGGGKMGSALLTGWLEAGLAPGLVQVVDPNPSASVRALSAQRGFPLERTLQHLDPGIVVLAVKPQSIDAVAEIASTILGDQTVVLSIMAGIKLERLRVGFPSAKSIVRGMPNLAASVGSGATLLVAEPGFEASDRRIAGRLLGVSGTVEWLTDETMMDAGTALSGSGPGYLFYVAECLAQAGERAGLPGELAARLARQTLTGAGALLQRSPKSAAELREEVTSPGGTTQAGLEVLAKDGRLVSAFAEAVAAAAARSRDLAG